MTHTSFIRLFREADTPDNAGSGGEQGDKAAIEQKPFYIDTVRGLINQFNSGELTISKLTELLNEASKLPFNVLVSIEEEAEKRYPNRDMDSNIRATIFMQGAEFAATKYAESLKQKDEEIELQHENFLKIVDQLNQADQQIGSLQSELERVKGELQKAVSGSAERLLQRDFQYIKFQSEVDDLVSTLYSIEQIEQAWEAIRNPLEQTCDIPSAIHSSFLTNLKQQKEGI